MVTLVGCICLLYGTTFSLLNAADGTYPMTTRQCYSSLVKPDKKLICPEQKNSFCVKEVSNLNEDLCGKTQYFGDFWDKKANLCYFKYCSDVCTSGDSSFSFGGISYTRNTLCCKNKNYCNSASNVFKESYSAVLFCSVITVILIVTA